MEPNLFFDLDGTLCNSEEGILNAVCYAIDRLGLPPQERGQLRHFIGPPLIRTFAADYGLSPESTATSLNTSSPVKRKSANTWRICVSVRVG